MPYEILKSGSSYKLRNKNTKKVYGTHSTKQSAQAQQQAIEASKKRRKK